MFNWDFKKQRDRCISLWFLLHFPLIALMLFLLSHVVMQCQKMNIRLLSIFLNKLLGISLSVSLTFLYDRSSSSSKVTKSCPQNTSHTLTVTITWWEDIGLPCYAAVISYFYFQLYEHDPFCGFEYLLMSDCQFKSLLPPSATCVCNGHILLYKCNANNLQLTDNI